MSQCSLPRSCGEPESSHYNSNLLQMCDLSDEGLLYAASLGKNYQLATNASVYGRTYNTECFQTPIFVLPRKPQGLISAAEALNAIKSSPSHKSNHSALYMEDLPLEGRQFSEMLEFYNADESRNVFCNPLLQPQTVDISTPSEIFSPSLAVTSGIDDIYGDAFGEYDPKSKDSVLQVLYKEQVQNTTRKLEAKSDKSNDSIQESGYKSYTTTSRPFQERRIYAAVAAEPGLCTDIVHADISDISANAAETDSELGKKEVLASLVQHALDAAPEMESEPYNTSTVCFCNNLPPNGTSGVEPMTVSAAVQGSSEEISKLILDLIGPNSRLGHLDDSLNIVKDHLTQIHHDINDFKDNCWKKIESKVSHNEFTDTTAILRAKMTYLERKMFNEQRLMRQDLRALRDRFNHIENESACSFKNFPIWPFVAFVGAYSIITFGHR